MDKEIRQMTMKPLLRSDEAGGDMVVEGYAAVFESPTVLYESEYSGYQYLEQITRGAFDGADMSRTVFKYNHGDNALVLARGRVVAFAPKDELDYGEFAALYRDTVGMGVA